MVDGGGRLLGTVAGHLIRDERSRGQGLQRAAPMAHAWNNAMFSIKERWTGRRRKGGTQPTEGLGAAPARNQWNVVSAQTDALRKPPTS